MNQERVLTVGELNHRIESSLASIDGMWVRGEIENINRRRDNCWYFNLAGADNQVIKAKAWGSHLEALRTVLTGIGEGSQVTAYFERVDYYGPHGSLALDVRDLKEQGDGTLLRARQAILQRLVADGLTDQSRKRQAPRYPQRVGLVTAAGSKACEDVCNAIWNRFPANITLVPARVQGPNSVISVIDAVGVLARLSVDVIIITRGGGEMRDLFSFDDELLCREIAQCPVPTLAAIGHTSDVPNLYAVADETAEVPGRVAEKLYPRAAHELLADLDEVPIAIQQLMQRWQRGIEQLDDRARWITEYQSLEHWQLQLHNVSEQLSHQVMRAGDNLSAHVGSVDQYSMLIELATRSKLTTYELELDSRCREYRSMEQISKMALVRDSSGSIIRSVRELAVGEVLHLELADGTSSIRVEQIDERT